MAYIGVSPSNGVRRKHTYTATANQTSFSGAGAEGATLSYNDSNFVDVYQNGVKLSEADYTSTSGTAIVLAQGASVSDIVEIVVYDVFSVADTVSKSAGGTFDGNVTMGGTLSVTGNVISPITLGGTTPTLTIGDAGAEDAKILFDGNAQDFYIGLDDSSDILAIGNGSDVGASRAIIVDANGIVRKSQQPAFMAQSVAQNNMATGGNDVTITFSNEIFDQNADYNASNYTFTAPVTGRYMLSTQGYLLNVDTAASYNQMTIRTSNRAYYWLLDPNGLDADVSYFPFTVVSLVDMDANDTAYVAFNQNNGTAQTDIDTGSRFSGYLVA